MYFSVSTTWIFRNKKKLHATLNDRRYLVGDFDEEGEDDDDKQVVDDADSSDDDVADLECEIADVCKIQIQFVIFRRGRRGVVPLITRQRGVLHR